MVAQTKLFISKLMIPQAIKLEPPTDWTGAVVRTGTTYQEVVENRGAVIICCTIYSKVQTTHFKHSVTFVHPDVNDWQPEARPKLTPIQKAFLKAYWERSSYLNVKHE